MKCRYRQTDNRGAGIPRFGRAHFHGFGDFSLNYEVVYCVLTPDYNQYRVAQQRINLTLKQELTTIGVEFAFPTHTLLIEHDVKKAY